MTLEKNADLIHQVLSSVFAPPLPASLARLRRPAFGRAYYALGRVAYNLSDTGLSWRYWLRALRYQPSKATDLRLLSMLARSIIGKNSLQRLRRLRRGWL